MAEDKKISVSNSCKEMEEEDRHHSLFIKKAVMERFEFIAKSEDIPMRELLNFWLRARTNNHKADINMYQYIQVLKYYPKDIAKWDEFIKAEIQEKIFAYKAEGMNADEIAERFNAEDEPTLSGKGLWSKNLIRKQFNLKAQLPMTQWVIKENDHYKNYKKDKEKG